MLEFTPWRRLHSIRAFRRRRWGVGFSGIGAGRLLSSDSFPRLLNESSPSSISFRQFIFGKSGLIRSAEFLLTRFAKPLKSPAENTTSTIHLRETIRRFSMARKSSLRLVRTKTNRKIVKLYAKDLTFDPNGLVNGFKASNYDGVEIWMRPTLRFGEPIVSGCGYTARTLYEATVVEGSYEQAASAYGISIGQVEAAYRYIQSLSNVA